MGSRLVILLDTNYLIRLLVAGTEEARRVDAWQDEGETLCTGSISWYEFLSGPVDAEAIELVRSLIGGRILPFVDDTAAETARLFNAAGRVRRLRVDAMIAATALLARARLATENRSDFRMFAEPALELL
ncbi:MAG: type II toxin-antitoxin system VapC family toxin [Spirochaetaceae bacterium]